MKTKLLALAFLAGGSMFAETRFSIGIHLGGYNPGPGYYAAAPPPYAVVRPPCPGPDYSWNDGYWDQGPGRGTWVNGYWNRQPDFRSYREAPVYERRGYDNRYNDTYTRRSEQYRSRGFDRDDRHDDRGRGNAYGNGFRNR